MTEPTYTTLYRFDPLERVGYIKRGMPARMVQTVADSMGIPKERLFSTLGLPRATVDRKVRENKPLSAGEGSRVLGVARLIGQAQAMVNESGRKAGFNAAAWVAQWLEEPLPALGSRRPAELMDTVEGQAIVADMLQRLQSGAYA